MTTTVPGQPGTIGMDGLNILVAEDSQINIMIMKKLLGATGANAVYVTDGAQAVASIQENNFDVVLMDIYMPQMDGYEATQLIRQMDDKAKASVYIIALTAALEVDLEEKLKNAGFNDHISKPLNMDELKQKVGNRMQNA